MKKQTKTGVLVAVAVLAVAAAALTGLNRLNAKNPAATVSAVNPETGDMVIQKGQITGKATFFSYQVGSTPMEVIAVKASDGTIRTAFNTCQVCYDSGRGYYKLEGDTLVCQNCGNRFSADQVEVKKGGCNPVAITKEYKTEDADKITLTKSFFEKTQSVFANWKK